MSTWNTALANPPEDPRRRELWLQHVAGHILMEDVRGAGLEKARAGKPSAVAVDGAVYGLMQVVARSSPLPALRTNDGARFTVMLVRPATPSGFGHPVARLATRRIGQPDHAERRQPSGDVLLHPHCATTNAQDRRRRE